MTEEQFSKLVIKGVDSLTQLGKEAVDLQAESIDLLDLMVNITGILVFGCTENPERVIKGAYAFMARFGAYIEHAHGVKIDIQIKGEQE